MNRTWLGRPIISDAHASDLETRAAEHEFGSGLSRPESEERAYQDYLREHHTRAAAHHLQGLRSAQANSDLEESRRHGTAYALHLQALGLEASDPVPESVRALTEAPDRKSHTKFKAHAADRLLLGDQDLVQ